MCKQPSSSPDLIILKYGTFHLQAQTEARMNMVANYVHGPDSLRPSVMRELAAMLHQCNPYVREFQRAAELAQVGCSERSERRMNNFFI